MDGFNDQNNTGYTDPGYAQDGYTQPQYTQPQYTQPQYTQTPDMGAYNQVNTEYQSGATKCPGKEITGFILGINSIVWGGLSLLCGFIPFYGMIFAFIWGGFGIGFGIAKALAKSGASVACIGTNEEKLNASVAEIVADDIAKKIELQLSCLQ